MALRFNNRVKETCAAPGTGTVTLLGPVTGFVGFSTIGTGNTTYYTIADQTGNNWEVGLGTWTTGGSYGTLARTTVFSNSAGTTANINFSSGIQDVFITGPSEKYLVGLTTELVGTYSSSTALGYDSAVLANNATAIGRGAQSNFNGIAIGVNAIAGSTSAAGGGSTAVGRGAIANGVGSVALGQGAYVNTPADYSIAIGAQAFVANNPNSIILSALGTNFNIPNSGVFITSIRDEASGSPDKVLKYNTTTKELFYGTGGGGGSGTVTDVSVVAANGFNGTVATSTTTPAITLTTTVTGVLKGNGTAISAAAAGTDYAPATTGTSILKGNGTGGFSSASAGTDYAPATSGTSILYGNGSGGFSNVTIGSGLDFTAGTLSAQATSPFPYTNPSTVSQNITVTTGNNAMLVGPITVANGYSITVDSGANFVVVT